MHMQLAIIPLQQLDKIVFQTSSSSLLYLHLKWGLKEFKITSHFYKMFHTVEPKKLL